VDFIISHLPWLIILVFLVAGIVERAVSVLTGAIRAEAESAGKLPLQRPFVCVQLPMYNEHAVCARIIHAAVGLSWPTDRLEI